MSQAAYELRAALRPLAATRRIADCGKRPVGVPALVVRDYPGDAPRTAWWTGTLACGRQYSCPVCAERRAASRASEIRRAGHDGARWQMVTLTMRHHRGEPLKTLLNLLLDALRRIRTTRPVREVYSRRVTASARAIEVTHGAHGWHPHIHLLLRTDEWSGEDRETLARAWERALPGRTEHGISVVWSAEGSAGDYLAKLGCELAGIGKSAPAAGRAGRSPWQIAHSALRNDADAALWAEYQAAMRGRRLLDLDSRAKALAEAAPKPAAHSKEWVIELYAEQYRDIARLEAYDPAVLWLLVEAALAAGPDPPQVVRADVDDLLTVAA